MNNFILLQETYYKFVLVWPEENKVFLYTLFWHTEHEPIFRVSHRTSRQISCTKYMKLNFNSLCFLFSYLCLWYKFFASNFHFLAFWKYTVRAQKILISLLRIDCDNHQLGNFNLTILGFISFSCIRHDETIDLGLSPCPSYGALQVRFYMHFPPGSNNRLNDAGENNTRLSDSQLGRPYPTLNLLAQA